MMNENKEQELPDKAEPPKDSTVAPQLSATDESILNAFFGKELYGLQIIEAFNEVSKGTRTISIGTLYPILSRMEKQGLVSSQFHNGSSLAKGGARRKLYKVTQSGLYALSENQRFRNELRQWEPGYGSSVYT